MLLATEMPDVPCSVSEESDVRWLCEVSVPVPATESVLPWTPLRASRVPPGPLVNPVPLPPPAAMAAALKTAAALRPSSTWCSLSTVASRRPSTWYGRASWRREQRIWGVQREEPAGGREDV